MEFPWASAKLALSSFSINFLGTSFDPAGAFSMCEFFWLSLIARFIFLRSWINLADPLTDPLGALAKSKFSKLSIKFFPLLADPLGSFAKLPAPDFTLFPVSDDFPPELGVFPKLAFESLSINLGDDPVFLLGAAAICFLDKFITDLSL